MITIFNRRELFSTFSMAQQARVQDALTQTGIDYKIKVINRSSPSPLGFGTRERTGTFGESQDLAYEYIFYVHKKDYDAACRVL